MSESHVSWGTQGCATKSSIILLLKVGVNHLAKPQEIKFSETDPEKRTGKEDVKIIWKGNRIARLIFKSGKVVEFQS